MEKGGWNIFAALIFLVCLYMIFNSEVFFNSIYFLYNSFKGRILINYTSEIGYYKYTEYIIAPLRNMVLIIVISIAALFLHLNVKSFIVMLISIILVLNFTFLNEKSMIQNMIKEGELEQVRNVYHMLFLYPKNNNTIVKTNVEYFSMISKLNKVICIYEKDINRLLYGRKKEIILIDLKKMDDISIKELYKEAADGNRRKIFECGNCLLMQM
jgi:hypothetical protein